MKKNPKQISPISSIDDDNDDIHDFDDYINRENMLSPLELITPKPIKRKRSTSDFNNLPLAKQKRRYEDFLKQNKNSDITFSEFKIIQDANSKQKSWIQTNRKSVTTSLPPERFPQLNINIIRPISPITPPTIINEKKKKKSKEIVNTITIPNTQQSVEEIKFINDITEDDFNDIFNTSNPNIGVKLHSPIKANEMNISGDYILKQLRDGKADNQGKGKQCGIQGQCFNLGHLMLTFDNVEKELKEVLFEQIQIIAERKFNTDEKRKVSITASHEVGNSTEHKHPHVHIALTTWPNEMNWHWHGHTFWDIEWPINGEIKYFHPNISYKDKRTAHITHQYVMKEDLNPIIYNRFEGLQTQLNKLNDPKADKKSNKDVSHTSSKNFFSFYYLRVR